MDETAEESFERLFREQWSRIFRVVYRLVGDRAEAEDITLEVFWRLYSHPPRTSSQGETLGWLYRVATNLGYNALRSRRRRVEYEISAGQQVLEFRDEANPELEAERSETRRRIRQVLVEMKSKQAKILVLRHSGLSYIEIAAALDIATGSVGTLLARAEKAFADRYRALEGA